MTIAIGTQRLALRSADEVAAFLERAAELGVDWLDVADIYGPAVGDVERRLAPFADRFQIVTKGGLVPQGRRFRADGRASHLIAAAESSRERLGVEMLDAFLLHAPDPRTAFRTSARALAKIADRGIAKVVGVANVTVGQLGEALDHAPVGFVQVPFSPLDTASARSGILEACRARNVPVFAHRALGGADRVARLTGHRVLADLAREREVFPAELALAWIASLGLIPLPGPSRIETLESCVRGLRRSLDDAARERLDAAFVEGGRLRQPRAERAPDPRSRREVRLVLGSPGAGKSTFTARFVDAGYARLNRDERGGSLRGLLEPLGELLAPEGGPSVVLDNTYASRAQRYDVIETAWAHCAPVRATVMDTPPEDCERNVISRILDQLGRLPEPEEIDALNKRDPAILPPRALLSFRSRFEPPTADEGFAEIERISFVRAPATGRPAVVVDPSGLEPFAGPLAEATAQGWAVLVVGWQEDADPGTVTTELEAKAAGLGIRAHAAICPHPGGPPTCWCRKPWLGLPVRLGREHGVNLDASIVVATSRADRTLADKLHLDVIETPDALFARLGDPP